MLRMAAVAAFSAAGGSVLFRYATRANTWRTPKTRKEAKCSDVITALKPTTGTEAASRVPNMICRKDVSVSSYHRTLKRRYKNDPAVSSLKVRPGIDAANLGAERRR
jgi:hypothetical protein